MTALRAIVPCAVAAVLTACQAQASRVWELDGARATDEQIASNAGPEHCDWESMTFLWVAWPPGATGRFADDGRQYLRDPEGLVLPDGLDLDAEVPDDAAPSGFRNADGLELWFAESDGGERAYLVQPDGSAEAWPRADGIACA